MTRDKWKKFDADLKNETDIEEELEEEGSDINEAEKEHFEND